MAAVVQHNTLYQAQARSNQSVHTHYLNRYDLTDLKWSKPIYLINNALYDSARLASQVITVITYPIFLSASFFTWAASPILSPFKNTFFPTNHINGKRKFHLIPRKIEEVLGKYLFYPAVTAGLRVSRDFLKNEDRTIDSVVQRVFEKLKHDNKSLLNPDKDHSFEYQVQTLASNSYNAFAVPGGNLAVFSKLVYDLDIAIKSGGMKELEIDLPNGKKATIDLSSVTLEDVVAALLGHEMTHIASRHSMSCMYKNLLALPATGLSSFLIHNYLKPKDPEYKELINKVIRTEEDEKKLSKIEKKYQASYEIIAKAISYISNLFSLSRSRENEYEADVTGTYFSAQAGFNPLGALFLQKFLLDSQPSGFLQKYFEFNYTHPSTDNRLVAIFAAISEIAPGMLSHVKWSEGKPVFYDKNNLSPAVSLANEMPGLLPKPAPAPEAPSLGARLRALFGA